MTEFDDNPERTLVRITENIDGEVLITTDPGNSWGYWGHPSGKPVPEIRYVPWILTTGEDTNTAEIEQWNDSVDISTDNQLRALGYY